MYVNNLTARRKGLQRFWLHPRDRHHAVTQTYNNCAETHLGGGVMSPFVSPLSVIARALNPTVIGSVALRKGPRRFCPHRSDRCCVLMLTCRNSPLWQRCDNVLSSFWPPWLDESRYVQTLLMRNKLRSLPLRCGFTLSSLKLSGWLRLLQPGHKRYRKRTESCSINAISLSVQIQQFSSTWRLSKVALLEGLFD